MKTVVITGSSRGLGFELAERFRKNGHNIVGDYPDVVADFLVEKILKNTKNDSHIQWLTGAKLMRKFMCAGFNKRDFFAYDSAKAQLTKTNLSK